MIDLVYQGFCDYVFLSKGKIVACKQFIDTWLLHGFKNLDKIAKFQNVTIRQNYTFLSRIFHGKTLEFNVETRTRSGVTGLLKF